MGGGLGRSERVAAVAWGVCDGQACMAVALVLVAAGWTMSAQAADMNYGSRAPYTVNQPLNAYSWAGPYLGGNLGYAWGSGRQQPDQAAGFPAAFRPATTGRTAHGCSALEGDIQATGAKDTFAPWKFSNPGSARCAAGSATPQQRDVLRHRRSGIRRIARQDLRPVGIPHQRRAGPRASAPKWASAPNWTAKVEYLYVDLSGSRFVVTGLSNGYRFGLVRVGRELSLLRNKKTSDTASRRRVSRRDFFASWTVCGPKPRTSECSRDGQV